MKNEYNSAPYEYKGAGKEYSEAEEMRTFAGNTEAEELFPSVSEYPEGNPSAKKGEKKKRQNDAKKMRKVVKGFFAVAVVASVAVVAVSASADISAEFVSLSVTESSVSYAVNFQGDREAELIVYNDFTRRRVALENGENAGEFTGLKSDMKYTVAVVYRGSFGEKTVTEQSVRTDKYPAPAPVTEIYSVEHECTCNIDGYFHFTLHFIDENAYWTEFEASLEDAYGNVSYCLFNEDVHAEQVIDVALQAGLLGNSATFTVACKTSAPDAESDTLVLYSATVVI